MAEIKSTLEMVMEKVAAMEPVTGAEVDPEEIIKAGMRLGAEYLRNEIQEIKEAVTNHPETDKILLHQGIVRSLTRNIILPREDELHDIDRAMQGLYEIGEGKRGVIDSLSDIKQIIERYGQHRTQIRQQLEDGIRQQLGQALAQQGMQEDITSRIDPTQHPKFQEEWQKVRGELNEQYGQALEQQKELLAQHLKE